MAESVVGLGFCLVVFTARPLFSVRQNVVLLRVHRIYLLAVASPRRVSNAGQPVVLYLLNFLREKNPIEFFGDRSCCPTNSIHHLPLSDRLIGTDRTYDGDMRGVHVVQC